MPKNFVTHRKYRSTFQKLAHFARFALLSGESIHRIKLSHHWYTNTTGAQNGRTHTANVAVFCKRNTEPL